MQVQGFYDVDENTGRLTVEETSELDEQVNLLLSARAYQKYCQAIEPEEPHFKFNLTCQSSKSKVTKFWDTHGEALDKYQDRPTILVRKRRPHRPHGAGVSGDEANVSEGREGSVLSRGATLRSEGPGSEAQQSQRQAESTRVPSSLQGLEEHVSYDINTDPPSNLLTSVLPAGTIGYRRSG